MATLRQLLDEIGQDLRDLAPATPHIAFPPEQLIAWINDGECILCNLRPDLFSRTRVIELVTGAEQRIEGCGVFSSLVNNVNADGSDGAPVRKGSYAAGQAWTKPMCARPPGVKYTVSTFRFDPNQKTIFYVEPPVPPGAKAKAKIVCAECPPALAISDLDDEFDADCYRIAMVKHYLYAQAFGMDSDQTNVVLAQFHLAQWNAFLIGKARADTAFSGGRPPSAAVQPAGIAPVRAR